MMPPPVQLARMREAAAAAEAEAVSPASQVPLSASCRAMPRANRRKVSDAAGNGEIGAMKFEANFAAFAYFLFTSFVLLTLFYLLRLHTIQIATCRLATPCNCALQHWRCAALCQQLLGLCSPRSAEVCVTIAALFYLFCVVA